MDVHLNKCIGLDDFNKCYLGNRVRVFSALLGLTDNGADCRLSRERHDSIMRNYWSDAFNGFDLVKDIKRHIHAD